MSTAFFDTAPSTFPTPWAARAFALVNAAAEAGVFDLRDFQQALIRTIQGYEASGGCIGDEASYYDCWIRSLTALVQERCIDPVQLSAMEALIRERYANRHGHAHGGHPQHPHDHQDHDHRHPAHPAHPGHPHQGHTVLEGGSRVPRPIYVERAQ
ncbi:MAG: nitrile hydratase accessory protein [Burkholderiales bacterium]|nr:nitrile hydratase accessory protein [Burkholderiales bacterium]